MDIKEGLVAGLVIVVFFSAIFSVIQGVYTQYSVTNETIVAGNGTTISVSYDKIVNGTLVVYNTSAQALTLDEGVDYTINFDIGTIYFDSVNMSGAALRNRSVDYTGYQDTYSTSGTTRTIFSIFGVIVGLVILMMFVSYIRSK